jgi:integrase
VGEVIRRTKNGKFLGYYLRFYDAGRRRILASKQPTLADARRMLLDIEARIARGERGIAEKRTEKVTVDALINRFRAEYDRPGIQDVERYREHRRSALRNVLRLIGDRLADQLRSADVARVRDLMRKTHAPGTINSALSYLSVAFSWGVRQELVATNPCKGVERMRVEGCIDFWSKEEVKQLLDAARQRQGNLLGKMRYVGIAIAVHTGLRKGELLGLRWTDVGLDTNRLTVARSFESSPKGNKTRHLRLPSVLVPILRAWRAECPVSSGGVILPAGCSPSRVGTKDASLGLDSLLAELGLRKVLHPWHLLRHTFASHFVMRGGNLLALQKILGHSDLKMTMIYAHLAPDFLGQEMERVSFED